MKLRIQNISTQSMDLFQGIGRINTLFSLFQQVKNDINDAVQPLGIRNLTDFGRYAQYRLKRLLLVRLPATCPYLCAQQFEELTESI